MLVTCLHGNFDRQAFDRSSFARDRAKVLAAPFCPDEIFLSMKVVTHLHCSIDFLKGVRDAKVCLAPESLDVSPM